MAAIRFDALPQGFGPSQNQEHEPHFQSAPNAKRPCKGAPCEPATKIYFTPSSFCSSVRVASAFVSGLGEA